MGREGRIAHRNSSRVTDRKLPTGLIHLPGAEHRRTVNPPVERASTVLFDTEAELYGPKPTYGRLGLNVHRELEQALRKVESASFATLAPSGLTACALAISSVVRAGDHVLLADNLYGPTRRFCERRLKVMGVSANRFPPRATEQLTSLIQENTRAIILEVPGSLTFEISDTPAITEIAKQHGLVTILDNTWGAGVYHQPLTLGVDISVQALTKYPVGHADAFGGAVLTNDHILATKISHTAEDWGLSLGSDDAYTALRGMRTLPMRLKAHEAAAMQVAGWLATHDKVETVLHPALASHPDHDIWKRDFAGSNGLFGVILKPCPQAALNDMFASLSLFRLGFSWGGFESLLIPCDEQLKRLSDDWSANKSGPLLRVHIGLEAVDDLIGELERAFQKL